MYNHTACAVVVSIAFLLALVGCSSQKDASAVNFESTINAIPQTKQLCVSLGTQADKRLEKQFMQAAATNNPEDMGVDNGNEALRNSKGRLFLSSLFRFEGGIKSRSHETYIALEKAGQAFGPWRDEGIFARFEYAVVMDSVLVDLKGMKNADNEVEQNICIGKRKVGKIVRWTEPAEVSGVKATSVEYSTLTTDVPPWASELVEKDSSEVKKIVLMLTNEGWIPYSK